MDANSGYHGYSMSRNAVAAYQNGEMPKSKWTKTAMLAAIEGYCWENRLEYPALRLKRMRKAELFDGYFSCTSWHHTSKFFNATDFYSVAGFALDEECAPLPQRDAIAMESCRLAAVEETALRNADAHRICAALYDDAEPLTVAAFAATYPQCVTKRVTKRGNVMYSLNDQGHSTFPGLEWNNERFGENLLS